MSSEPTVPRAAAAGDLAGLLDLYRALNPSDPEMTAEEANTAFAAMLAQPGLTVFLATEGEEAVATATLQIVPNLTPPPVPMPLSKTW
jgi:hypothetical protein